MELKKMSIEQKMIYVRRALEMGADIQLSFHEITDKGPAEKAAVELSELTNIPYQLKTAENTHWFKMKDWDNGLDIVIFFEEKEEEVSA